MKAGDERSEGDIQKQGMPLSQQNNNSDDGKLLGERPATELEHTQNIDSTSTTPRVLEINSEGLLEENENQAKGEYSVKEKREEDIEDDDDFDLEYGNNGNEEAEEDGIEAGGVELKADDNKSPLGSSSASETPKPRVGSIDESSEGIEASAQVESMTEIVIEEILDEVSQHDVQQPEDIEDSVSEANNRTPEHEDEELIEYEEDDKTSQQSVTANAPAKSLDEHQPAESRESSHHSHVDQEVSHASSSPRDSTSNTFFLYSLLFPYQVAYSNEMTGIQKLESPASSSSSEPDRAEDLENVDQANDLSGTNGDNAGDNEDVSRDPKVPASIPVFQGGDSPEGEYEYVEDQQQEEYDGYGYDDQGQNFELEEGEYDENRDEVGYENDHDDNPQDPEYPQGQFEYNADYPTDRQNEYLHEDGNQLQGDADEYDHYIGDDGAYNEFEGGQEYPAEVENGYPIGYPQEGYDNDSTTYQHEEFGDVGGVETAGADEFGIPIKGDQENTVSPSDAVDILKKSSPLRQAEEEEQLIDYEDDEVELAQEEHKQKSPAELQKSPGDQKRMREDEVEKEGYESTGENQGSWHRFLYNDTGHGVLTIF